MRLVAGRLEVDRGTVFVGYFLLGRHLASGQSLRVTCDDGAIGVKGGLVPHPQHVERTTNQDSTNQLPELSAVARRRGWSIVETYSDDGISGARGCDQRPALDRMMKDATRGRFDAVAAGCVDRLGRSVLHVAQVADDLQKVGCGLYVHKQAIDSTTATG